MSKRKSKSNLSTPVRVQPQQINPHETSRSLPDKIAFSRQELFIGQLPHPEHFRQYEEVMPGISERLVRMAEAEQSHRHRMDHEDNEFGLETMRKDHSGFVRAQWMALAVSLAAMGGAVYLVITGHEAAAAGFGLVGIGSLVTLFLKSRFATPVVAAPPPPQPQSPSATPAKKSQR